MERVLLFIFVVAVDGGVSYFISQKVYNKLVKNGNGSANLLRWVTLVGCFIIILAVLFFLYIYNLSIER